MVLDPETLDMKEEWLQALDLCQQSEMPEEIQGRIKESAETDDGDEEPEEGGRRNIPMCRGWQRDTF